LSKVDDEFNKWTFTDTQKDLLSTFLTSIYINLMSNCPLVANKSASANMYSIIDELRSVSFHTNGKVSAPLMHVSKFYVLNFIDMTLYQKGIFSRFEIRIRKECLLTFFVFGARQHTQKDVLRLSFV
jgi:hypothetical protein